MDAGIQCGTVRSNSLLFEDRVRAYDMLVETNSRNPKAARGSGDRNHQREVQKRCTKTMLPRSEDALKGVVFVISS